MAVFAIAAFTLPHSYRAYATFIAPSTVSVNAQLAGESDATSVALRDALGAVDAALESPSYYSKLLESEELRRRVLLSRFRVRGPSGAADSATLVDIMRIDAPDPDRQLEMASRRLKKAT